MKQKSQKMFLKKPYNRKYYKENENVLEIMQTIFH